MLNVSHLLVALAADPAAGDGTGTGMLASFRLDWETFAAWSVRVGAALLVRVVAWVASSWLRRLIKQGTHRAQLDPTLGSFFANAARWGVLTLGAVTCLG
ncbi:MAG: mechanosensitive ion channel family protein, partial [Phycisphaerae bacterium]